MFVIACAFATVFTQPHASAEDTYCLSAEIVNGISSYHDRIDGTYGIDFFNGMPLRIDVKLVNETRIKFLNDLSFQYIPPAEAQNQSREFSKEHPEIVVANWSPYLEIALFQSSDEKKNLLPLKKSELNDLLSKTTILSDKNRIIFSLPENYTNSLKPDKYLLTVYFDNGVVKLKSNKVVFSVKNPKTNYENAQILWHRGKELSDFKKCADAILLFQNAIDLCPEFPTPYQGIADCFLQLNEINQAIENYKKCIRVIQNTPLKYWSENKERQQIDTEFASAPLQNLNESKSTIK